MAINLKSLRKGSVARPPRIVLYGTHGVGKSSFAAQADKPVFIQTEEGLDALNVTAFPLSRSYDEVMEAIGSLYTEDHDFGTVVLDSADWMEQLIFKQVAINHKINNIEDMGYGKGYAFAVDLWRNVMEGFDLLRNEKICRSYFWRTHRSNGTTILLSIAMTAICWIFTKAVRR